MINQSLAAAETIDPLLPPAPSPSPPTSAKPPHDNRTVLGTWLPQPPTGRDGLTALLHAGPRRDTAA